MLAGLTGLGLSAAAGLNAYIPMLVVGVLDRYTDWVRLPDEFGWLTNGWVLAVLAALLAAEVVLDKIPAVDSVNDLIQTVVRPASGGAVFAATDAAGRFEESSFFQEHSWIGWTAGIVVALLVHLGKMSVRPVVNAGTLGTGAPVVSTVEDGVSLGMSVLAILAPIVAFVALLLLVFVALRLARSVHRRRRRRRTGAAT